MYFDLRTCESAFEFILDSLQMDRNTFSHEYILKSGQDFDVFWNRNSFRTDYINTSSIRIMAFHVLGSLDDCAEIKANGLWDLQRVLSNDTILSQLLKEQGISFNILEKTLKSGTKTFDIDYDHYRNKHFLSGIDESLSHIAHRLFYDFCVNGFLVNDNVFNYGTQIHERPEFLMLLSDLLPNAQKVEKYWKEHANSYRVDFFVTKDQVHRFNFSLDEYRDPPFEDWTELDDDTKIKKWMLAHAIYRAYDQLNEEFLYIKDGAIVPPDQILSYTRI